MASSLYLIVLVLVSISVTSVYSLSTRDAVLKHDDESYFMATSELGSSIMIEVEDLAKARSLQALVAGSKVVVNKAASKSTSTKSKSSKKKKHKRNKVGSLDSAIVGIIIAAVVITIVIICVVYFFYLRHKTKKAQSIGQATEKINGSSETQTSKTEDHV
uniref:Transmembrane protein n=1 Tax=Noccaea caerulescens TaxID=107243 RepID=A0A1J3GHU9_NOCCA